MKKIISTKWTDEYVFVITMWLLSRLVIIVGLQLIAPLCHLSPINYTTVLGYVPSNVPKSGWELFSHWDGAWYRKITISGYDYAIDGQPHSIAFLPLFPLLTRAVMLLGLPFNVAGTLVNNLAFLGALLFLYLWARERYSISIARWATAVLAWFPFSLYGTVIYTDGLFLLLTTAALQAFDNRQYTRAALWGALATATRTPAAALVPAFLLVAWRERRPAMAYVAAIASGLGLLSFSIYCAIRFADPLAFFHGLAGWKGQPNWLEIFAGIFNLSHGFHAHTAAQLSKVLTLLGSTYLLWHLRAKLPYVAVTYGFCSLGLILYSGATDSFNRYIFGIVSLSLALGLLLARYPRWGYVLMGLFAISLVGLSIRFAWWYWVA